MPAPATGSVTVGGTATQVVATSTPFTYKVTITAAKANTGTVYIGFSNAVTANSAAATDGLELLAGASKDLAAGWLDDVSQVWIIASTTGQKAFWLCQ